MKDILYICAHNPFEIHSGAHQRTNLICRALSEIAHVDVICFTSDDNILPNKNNIPNCSVVHIEKRTKKPGKAGLFRFVTPFLYFFSPQSLAFSDTYCQKKIRAIMENKNYDYIVVRYINYAIEFGIHFDEKVIIDLDDLPEQFYQSIRKQISNNKIKKLYYSLLEKLAMLQTRRIVAKVKHVYLPIQSQALLFPNAFYLTNIPYIVSLKGTKEYVNENFEIMFVGNLSYQPNHDGINHFLESVWPTVAQELPQAHFNIVGSYLSNESKQQWESYERTSVIGFVENLEEVYAKNSLVVVPVYHGAGTNIKVLEAMYMSKACVITSFASEGFEDLLVDGDNIFIAKDDNDFAFEIIHLLTDRNCNKRTGENAKTALTQEYTYENFRKIVQNSIN
jgi:glycosyltransferase involved in cell wall biosynthesis